MHWPSVPPRNCSSRVRSIYQSFDIRTHFRLSTLTLSLASFTFPPAVRRAPALPRFRGESLPRPQGGLHDARSAGIPAALSGYATELSASTLRLKHQTRAFETPGLSPAYALGSNGTVVRLFGTRSKSV